jgi:hypothetical protein
MSAAGPQKPVGELTVQDLKSHPVWRFLPEGESPDETWVAPVRRLPVSDLDGCLAAAVVRTPSGREITACLGNVSLSNPAATQHFLTLAAFRGDGAQFHLARYHDTDYTERGPEAFAAFLGWPVAEVFPLAYDLSAVAQGVPEVVRGTIYREPRRRLSEEELIALSLE